MRYQYSTSKNHMKVWILILCVLAIMVGVLWFNPYSKAAEGTITCYVMCKPGEGNYVVLREKPDKDSQAIGRLEACDSFETDAKSRNGFIHVLGLTEYGEAWIYCGFVVTEEPEEIFCNCYCSAYGRVACRRWIGGPLVEGRSWLAPLDDVTVFYKADGWSVTSRGYIKSEYLEEDPIL